MSPSANANADARRGHASAAATQAAAFAAGDSAAAALAAAGAAPACSATWPASSGAQAAAQAAELPPSAYAFSADGASVYITASALREALPQLLKLNQCARISPRDAAVAPICCKERMPLGLALLLVISAGLLAMVVLVGAVAARRRDLSRLFPPLDPTG